MSEEIVCCACPDLVVNAHDIMICRNCATCHGVSLDATQKRKDYTTSVYAYSEFAKSLPKDESKGADMSDEVNVERSMKKDYEFVKASCGDYVSPANIKEAIRIYMSLQPLNHRAAPKRAVLAACVFHACASEDGDLLFKSTLAKRFNVKLQQFDKRFEEVRSKAREKGLKIADVDIQPCHTLLEICKVSDIPKDIAARAMTMLEKLSDDPDLERHSTKSLVSAILAILYGDECDYGFIAKACHVTNMTTKNIKKKIEQKYPDFGDD